MNDDLPHPRAWSPSSILQVFVLCADSAHRLHACVFLKPLAHEILMLKALSLTTSLDWTWSVWSGARNWLALRSSWSMPPAKRHSSGTSSPTEYSHCQVDTDQT